MMNVMRLVTLILSVAALVQVVSSDKDTNFYYAGFTNPNIQHEMYWKDAVNVLQDLSQFSALYIQHHGCVHSSYAPASSDDEDEVDGDGISYSYCGFDGDFDGDGTTGQYWYLGVSPCFKANSVFSLYGILRSNPQDADSDGSYCHQATYIDTYFTRAGVETIGLPFGFISDEDQDGEDNNNGYYTASSYCLNDGDDEDGQQGGDDDYVYSYNAGDHTSYGTGCYDKAYVYDSFEGSFCSGHKVKETIDSLDTFNANMDSLTCTQIYDGSNYNNDGNQDEDGYSPLDILSYSHSCSVTIYPDDCVDPYGLKNKYAKALRNALTNEEVTAAVGYDTQRALRWTTWALLMVGFALFGSTYYLRRKLSSTRKDRPSEVKSVHTSSSLSSPAVFVREISSTISKTAESIKESIIEYADEEVLPPTTTRDYVVPAEELVVGDEEKDLTPANTGDYVVPAEEPVTVNDEKDLTPMNTGDYVAPAEEPIVTDEEKDLAPTSAGDYVAPTEELVDTASASAQGDDESKDESNKLPPEELPVDKGEASLPPPPPISGKKYKRPMLHKISKKLFGHSKKKSKKIKLEDSTMASI